MSLDREDAINLIVSVNMNRVCPTELERVNFYRDLVGAGYDMAMARVREDVWNEPPHPPWCSCGECNPGGMEE